MSPRASALISLAEHAAGRLSYAVRAVPDQEALVYSLLLRDVLSSARLSGHTVSPIETWKAALIAHHPRGAGGRARADVDAATGDDPLSRFVRAARLLADEIAEGEPADAALLGRVSAVLTGHEPGSTGDGLRRTESVLTAGPDGPPYARATPPDQLPSALAAWDEWLAGPFEGPRLARIAVGHAVLELNQPYPVANGHVTRLFTTAELVRRGLVDVPVLSLSPWLDDHGEEYHRRLLRVAEHGEWSAWVEFFARGVQEQALATIELIHAQAELREELARSVSGPPSLRKVLDALPTAPVTSIQALVDLHGLYERTAAQITRDLERQGTLRALVERPFRIFVCDRAMDVLSLQRAAVTEHVRDAFRPPADPPSTAPPEETTP